MYPYRFVKTVLSNALGIGAEGLALAKPQTNPLNDGFFRRGFVVQRSMAPTSEGYVKVAQEAPNVALRGNGQAVTGQFTLQALSRLSNPNG